MTTTSNKPARPKPDWKHARDFTDTATGLTLRVSRSPGHRTIYSQEIGRVNKDNKFIRHFPIFASASNAKVSVEKFPVDVFARLMLEMEAWVTGERQAQEDGIIGEKLAREQASINRDKPQTRPGLKSLSKLDAQKRVDVKDAPVSEPNSQE